MAPARFAMMLGLFVALAAPAQAAPGAPYRLAETTLLPDMPEGDFDQLAADVRGGRLYVSAEDGGRMYVFDLRSGALVRQGGPVGSPHKVVFDGAHDHVLVADGGDGSVKVLGTDLALVARVPVGPKPDTGVIDPAAHLFYVSSRDPAPDAAGSIVSAISTDTLRVVATYAVPATTLKGLELDRRSRRLFVSMRDRNGIAIIHLADGAVETVTPPGLHKNVPLAFDARSGLLYVGSRGPGRLDVVDLRSAVVRTSLASTETSDSLSFDRRGRTLYLSGDSGMSRYRIAGDGMPRLLETDPALVGKTSLYVPELKRLYVMRPTKPGVAAALQIFDVRG